MMQTVPHFWPKEAPGLPLETIMSLSADARALYDAMYDYCTYASDPQYQMLHKFRNRINKFTGADREALIAYFNNDPAIRWTGMPCAPYEYYAKPY
jgi:hypothetical protein